MQVGECMHAPTIFELLIVSQPLQLLLLVMVLVPSGWMTWGVLDLRQDLLIAIILGSEATTAATSKMLERTALREALALKEL